MEAALRNDCREFVASRMPVWIRLFQDLICIPSTFENEHAIVAFVQRHLKSIEIAPALVAHNADRLHCLPRTQHPISTVAGRNSLAVRIPGAGTGRSIAFNSHLDVVPAVSHNDWEHPPYSGEIEIDRNVIHGRGAMDDKAGVVISLAILEVIANGRLRLGGDAVFHFALEDETTGNGTLLCLDAGYNADGAVIIDGTRPDRAINEHAGNLQFELRVTGKPASVSVSHMGVNAAEVLAGAALRLRESVHSLNQGRSGVWTQFPSPFQISMIEIQGHGESMTLPESAVARFYATFPPPFNLREFKGLLERTVVETISGTPGASFELKWTGLSVEPVKSESLELEGILQESALIAGFCPIQFGPSTGTSDMRHFVESGIPCLLYGPGRGFNPHRANEHYYLDDLPTMILAFLELASSWCI
jgi:acetylornithine deacetylase